MKWNLDKRSGYALQQKRKTRKDEAEMHLKPFVLTAKGKEICCLKVKIGL